MNKTVLLLFAAFCISSVYAENDFEEWKKKQQDAYTSFLSEQEKAFSQMLQKEWEEFRTQRGFIIDKTPKPDKQPAVMVKDTTEADILQQSDSDSEPLSPLSSAGTDEVPAGQEQNKPAETAAVSAPDQKKLKILSPEKKKDTSSVKIDFYGTQFNIPVPENLKIRKNTSKLSNKAISDFFEYYSEQKMDSTISFIKSLSSRYSMNGWSVIKITEKTSNKIYKSETDAVIMTWFLLLKAGYDVKIAYSSNNVFLLYLPEVKVYSVPYISEKKKNYYFYNKKAAPKERIKTYSGNFVKSPSLISLTPENPKIFRQESGSRNTEFRYKRKKYPVSLRYNINLISYYNEYPQADISVYFKGNISDQALNSFKRSLYPYIRNMKEKDAVQFILSFVQNGFKYKTDGSQFGYEKPMFPDETLHYPFIDCEDRSALFISIVKELTGLDAVALDYPGHIAAAVNFKSSVKGDYINYKGRKYTVCDPTYINASIGMTMPDYKNVKPEIIETGY